MFSSERLVSKVVKETGKMFKIIGENKYVRCPQINQRDAFLKVLLTA